MGAVLQSTFPNTFIEINVRNFIDLFMQKSSAKPVQTSPTLIYCCLVEVDGVNRAKLFWK